MYLLYMHSIYDSQHTKRKENRRANEITTRSTIIQLCTCTCAGVIRDGYSAVQCSTGSTSLPAPPLTRSAKKYSTVSYIFKRLSRWGKRKGKENKESFWEIQVFGLSINVTFEPPPPPIYVTVTIRLPFLWCWRFAVGGVAL